MLLADIAGRNHRIVVWPSNICYQHSAIWDAVMVADVAGPEYDMVVAEVAHDLEVISELDEACAIGLQKKTRRLRDISSRGNTVPCEGAGACLTFTNDIFVIIF